MVYPIVVNDDGRSRTDSCLGELLEFRRDLRLGNSVSVYWVDNLHDGSLAYCTHGVGGGTITPSEEFSSCLSLLPYVSLEVCFIFERGSAVFEKVLKNLGVFVLFDPVTAALSKLVVPIWSPVWLFFAVSKRCADRREEAVSIAFNRDEPCSILEVLA